MTREKAIEILWCGELNPCVEEDREACEMAIKALICSEMQWIPVKWHEITDEEREREGYPEEWSTLLDCIMPNDREEILITDKRGIVSMDVCQMDDGCYLDSGFDWIDDVVAWMPKPKPYKAESEVCRNDENRRK